MPPPPEALKQCQRLKAAPSRGGHGLLCALQPCIELPADLLSQLSAARSCLRAAASGGCGVRCLENARTHAARK